MDMIFLENMNIIYILFLKNGVLNILGFVVDYKAIFVQFYKKHFYNYFTNVFFFISFEIYVLSILYLSLPPPQKKSENRKA